MCPDLTTVGVGASEGDSVVIVNVTLLSNKDPKLATLYMSSAHLEAHISHTILIRKFQLEINFSFS